jgi:hypothetical protein
VETSTDSLTERGEFEPSVPISEKSDYKRCRVRGAQGNCWDPRGSNVRSAYLGLSYTPGAAWKPSGYSSSMNRPRTLLLALAALFLTLGEAHAQYAYVTHPGAVVEQAATTALLPANPFRAFVYCVIASPGRGEPLAPSVVRMGDATTAVPVQYPDRPPKLWASTSKVWVFSDQTALISCTELVRRQKRDRASETAPAATVPQ